ncbi:preprotein translocase subunit SecY [Roseburia hominis]
MSQANSKSNIIKYKILYTCIILFVYELGKGIPLYEVETLARSIHTISAEEILIQTISGDAYRSSVFALGIFPYMISSLLVQIAMAILNAFSKDKVSPGKLGRITALVTFVVAMLQAFSLVRGLQFRTEGVFVREVAVMEMVTGAMLIWWMSDRIGRYGIGGRMMIGLVNIVSRIGSTIIGHSVQELIVPLAISAAGMLIMMIMENAEFRIPVQRISIHNVYADKNYMAVKLNPAGVMPMMFSTVVFMLPQLVVSLLEKLFPGQPDIIWWQANLSLARPLGIGVYIICMYLLTIFLAIMTVNPKDITEQFLKSGDSIVGIHAGRDTRRYLRKVIWSISIFSATVMGGCVAVPLVLQLRGSLDSTLVMLPTTVMMLTGLWCNFIREYVSVRKYDLYHPIF